MTAPDNPAGDHPVRHGAAAVAGPATTPAPHQGEAVALDVDARGLNCPLPILRAKKALATLASGQLLRVTATDPGSERDFEAFCRQTGNALVAHGSATQDGQPTFSFVIRRR